MLPTVSASRASRLAILVVVAMFVGWLGFGASAEAQVFKPRGKQAAAGKAGPGAAAARKATPTPIATPSKKPTRTMGPTPRRVNAPPAKKSRATSKGRAQPAEDEVRIDDDDDDVKIVDDE